MAAYQVPNNYDPNAPTYLPGTQDDEENGAPKVGMTSAPKPYMPPTNTDYAAAPTPSMSTGTQKASDAPAPPQTFSQMQEQGIARPPAPATLDPIASPMQASSVGDASPQASSAPGAGMTTAQWDAYAPTSGMTEAEKAATLEKNASVLGRAPIDFSGYSVANTQTGTTGDPNAGGSVATYSANPAAIANLTSLTQNDPNVTGEAAAQAAAAGNYTGTTQAGNQANTLADWAAYANSVPGKASGLDPTQLPAGYGTPSPNVTQGMPAAYDPTRPVQPNNGAVDANGNYVLPGTTPTYLPPGGVSSSTGFTPTNNPAPPGTSGTSPTTQLPPQNGAQTPTGGTAGTTPTGGAYDVLNAITQGAQGQGGGSAVQNATQQKTLDLLNNPSPYNEADVKDFYNSQAQNIDDQYALQQKALSEDMARRGLGNSTIFGGNLEDLNIGKRSAQTALSEDLAHQYAQSLGQYQTGAVNTGNTVGNTAQQAQQSWIQQLMGYGQNAFNNDLETNQQNQNASNNWQNYILQLLGMGYSPTG